VRDLLGEDSKAELQLKEDPGRGVFVKDLSEEVVRDVEGINKVMDKGFQNRTVGSTLMNAGSSRSHSIFTVVIEANETNTADGKERLRAGKLNLVDLAGSERQSKTGATGKGCLEVTYFVIETSNALFFRGSLERRFANQPLPFSAGERDLRTGGRQGQAHSLPRLQAHEAAARLARGKHQDTHGCRNQPSRLQLR